MAPIYDYAKLPEDRELVRRISAASDVLFEKLSALAVDRIDLSDYNKAYVRRYQAKLRSNLQRLAYILAWALDSSKKLVNDTVLLDYGGGAGLLTLLAIECGVGRVIYNDIYDVSCVDAETIGNALGNHADYYIRGDIGEVIEFLDVRSISCDVVVTSDVVEHIHDVDGFFGMLHRLSKGHLSVTMSTHANPLNPFLRRTLMKKQWTVENVDREYTAGHKKRDSLKSYLSVRREVILDHANGVLSEAQVDDLAQRTRGMIREEIRAAVETHINTGELPAPPAHPTNTCDPVTGNWADRLVDPRELQRKLTRAGFSVDIRSGYYGRPVGLAKKLVASALDLLIRLSGLHGTRLAPFFLLHSTGEVVAAEPATVAQERQPQTLPTPSAEPVVEPAP